jgi:hypothetical protein
MNVGEGTYHEDLRVFRGSFIIRINGRNVDLDTLGSNNFADLLSQQEVSFSRMSSSRGNLHSP